jgi:hypothetical protein
LSPVAHEPISYLAAAGFLLRDAFRRLKAQWPPRAAALEEVIGFGTIHPNCGSVRGFLPKLVF